MKKPEITEIQRIKYFPHMSDASNFNWAVNIQRFREIEFYSCDNFKGYSKKKVEKDYRFVMNFYLVLAMITLDKSFWEENSTK